jgi:hypothetical protein
MIEAAAELLAGNPKAQWIETCKGRAFYLDAPVFAIEEIAHSLSNMCRYAGHCSRFYSVAEHSYLVSRIMDVLQMGDPLEGLLHDGAESVLADIASPWKVLLPDYKRMEHKMEVALRKQFELPLEITEGCKTADWIALAIEAKHLLPTKGRDWLMPPGVREKAMEFEYELHGGWYLGYAPGDAKRIFLREATRLGLRWQHG